MVAVGLAFVAGIAGWAIGHAGRSAGTAVASTTLTSTSAAQGAAIDPSVAAGAHDFVQFACAKCHGEQGRGGVSPSVPTATPLPIPRNQGLAVAGAALYVSDGCINCHGPNGLGGVPNPQSEDKTIPPLSGVDFRGEFNTDAKIIDFIRTGSVLGRAPIVSMPHWGGIISDQELT